MLSKNENLLYDEAYPFQPNLTSSSYLYAELDKVMKCKDGTVFTRGYY